MISNHAISLAFTHVVWGESRSRSGDPSSTANNMRKYIGGIHCGLQMPSHTQPTDTPILLLCVLGSPLVAAQEASP